MTLPTQLHLILFVKLLRTLVCVTSTSESRAGLLQSLDDREERQGLQSIVRPSFNLIRSNVLGGHSAFSRSLMRQWALPMIVCFGCAGMITPTHPDLRAIAQDSLIAIGMLAAFNKLDLTLQPLTQVLNALNLGTHVGALATLLGFISAYELCTHSIPGFPHGCSSIESFLAPGLLVSVLESLAAKAVAETASGQSLRITIGVLGRSVSLTLSPKDDGGRPNN